MLLNHATHHIMIVYKWKTDWPNTFLHLIQQWSATFNVTNGKLYELAKIFAKTSNINLIPSYIQHFVKFKQHVLKPCEPIGLLLSNKGQYDCKYAQQRESKMN